MQITRVEPVVLGVPLATPVRTSFGTMTHRFAILVRVETNTGLVGWGESWSNFPAWSPRERVPTIVEGLAPLVVGEDPRSPAFIHEKLVQATSRLALQWGAPGPIAQAISAIDIALWDLLGKEVGRPICQLLGGRPRPVPVYASGLGPENPVPLALPLLERGVGAFKVKVGFGEETDLRNLAALRECIGPGRLLLTDANQAWDLPTARRMLARMAPYDPYWLEEPLPADQIEALAELRRTSPVRIVAGENIYGRAGFLRLLSAGAVDVVQPDVCKTGGITEAHAICNMARAFGIPYAPHYLGGAIGLVASLHLSAATPGLWRLELDANPNPLREELVGDCLAVKDGCLTVPDGPGLGVEPSPKVLARYRWG